MDNHEKATDLNIKLVEEMSGGHGLVVEKRAARYNSLVPNATKRSGRRSLKTIPSKDALTALGHGSNVRGIKTVATYDSNTEEFFINTPCESAQNYWIGGAANDATHIIVLSQRNHNQQRNL